MLLAWSGAHSAAISYTNIKSLYKEGEFEKIQVSLESFLKQNGKSAETKDRIFAYKYLGVIYAAEPESYAVAESYFYQLLKLAPNAYISDLYASSAVESVFQRAQERFRKENRDFTEFDEFGNPRVSPDPKSGVSGTRGGAGKDTLSRPYPRPVPDPVSGTRKPPPEEAKIKVWPWVLGTAAVAALGGYLWYASQEKEETKTNTFPGSP